MIKDCLVTVYITTFNRLNLLKRALISVQTQTYKNLEIIVVDDCSSDGTQEYLKSVAQQDSRIKFFLKSENSGACASRNIAINNASGEYITGLDDDDYFLSSRVEDFLNFNDSKSVFIYNNNIVKMTENQFKKQNLARFFKKKVYAKDLLFNNYIGNQVFIKTEILKECGGFDVEMPMWQDLECWYRVLKYKNGYAINMGKCNYIFDISHEKDRISQFNFEKSNKAFNLFCLKHKISGRSKSFLYSHFYNYEESLFNVKVVFFKLVYGFNVYDFKRFFKYFFVVKK